MKDTDLVSLVGERTAAKLSGASLLELDAMTPAEMTRLGLTAAAARRVRAAFSLGRRVLCAESEAAFVGEPLTSPAAAFAYFCPRFANLKREQFHVALVDNKNRVIRTECISEGSLTASVVHPREVFNPVIRESAAGVVFAHNHPSGDPHPSREDVDLTRKLTQVAAVLGVKVHDHLVCGHGCYFSFANEGML